MSQYKSTLVGIERNGSGRPSTNFECGVFSTNLGVRPGIARIGDNGYASIRQPEVVPNWKALDRVRKLPPKLPPQLSGIGWQTAARSGPLLSINRRHQRWGTARP